MHADPYCILPGLGWLDVGLDRAEWRHLASRITRGNGGTHMNIFHKTKVQETQGRVTLITVSTQQTQLEAVAVLVR